MKAMIAKWWYAVLTVIIYMAIAFGGCLSTFAVGLPEKATWSDITLPQWLQFIGTTLTVVGASAKSTMSSAWSKADDNNTSDESTTKPVT